MLLDIGLPVLSGYEVCRRCAKRVGPKDHRHRPDRLG
jgi:CheY-like chemotaxis protein